MIRPEDESKISQMTTALRLSRGKACILLVSFNDELLRRDIEAEIKRRLEPQGYNFREFRMSEDGYRNLPIMLVDMKPQPGDIFLIFDLKKALPEVLEYLNYRREDFVEHKISAIFWLDELTLTGIARKAPDFWAFRNRTFEFTVNRKRDMQIPGRTTLSELFVYSDLEELDSKIALREEMLADYIEKVQQYRSTIAGLHNEIGLLYDSKSQLDKAITHYKEALELYRELNDRGGQATALGNLGIVCGTKGELDKALDYFCQSLQIYRRIGDIEGEAASLINLGMVYVDKDELDKALEYCSQALEMSRRISYIQGEAIALGDIGFIYRGRGDLDKALEHYSKALEIDRRIGYFRGEAAALGNIGVVHKDKGDLDKALEHYSQALEVSRRIGHVQGEADQLDNMGEVYQDKGDLDKALEHYSQALETFRRIGDVRGEAIGLYNTGTAYQYMGDLRTALTYVEDALRMFISIGMLAHADRSYGRLQEIIEQMETSGLELSEEDRDEIARLTEEYKELKAEAADSKSADAPKPT